MICAGSPRENNMPIVELPGAPEHVLGVCRLTGATCVVIDLPRPRTLEDTFEPAFIDIVHALRNEISTVRAA